MGSKRSKRAGFRFQLPKRSVTYMANGMLGKGVLANISAGGCALQGTSTTVSVGDQIMVVVERSEGERPLELQGRVVRARENELAAEFVNVDDYSRTELITYFAWAARADKDK